jgi:hypothetical protein
VDSVRAVARRLAAKVKAALWNALRSDKVRPFIWVYYIPLLAWGIYGTFFAGPATYVYPVMGHVVYDVWIWLCMLGTAVVLCGLTIEDSAHGERHRQRAGLVLQGSGHACMFWVLLSYEMSAVTATHWGQGTFSVFAVAPYVAGCLLLTAQAVMRVLDGAR